MGKWLVRLKGDKFDLEDLPALFDSPELAVVEENGFYYLQSCKLESLTSADEVREQAVALINILNGVTKLYRDCFSDASEDGITRIEDNGQRHHNVYIEVPLTTIRVKARASVIVTTRNGIEKKVSQPTNIRTWTNIAMNYKPVENALYFFREGTWDNLYKVYEIIRDDAGNEQAIIKKSWGSKRELHRFTQIVQSSEALGDDARHASKKYKPPAQPMSLTEAKSLIRGILTNWMQTKI